MKLYSIVDTCEYLKTFGVLRIETGTVDPVEVRLSTLLDTTPNVHFRIHPLSEWEHSDNCHTTTILVTGGVCDVHIEPLASVKSLVVPRFFIDTDADNVVPVKMVYGLGDIEVSIPELSLNIGEKSEAIISIENKSSFPVTIIGCDTVKSGVLVTIKETVLPANTKSDISAIFEVFSTKTNSGERVVCFKYKIGESQNYCEYYYKLSILVDTTPVSLKLCEISVLPFTGTDGLAKTGIKISGVSSSIYLGNAHDGVLVIPIRVINNNPDQNVFLTNIAVISNTAQKTSQHADKIAIEPYGSRVEKVEIKCSGTGLAVGKLVFGVQPDGDSDPVMYDLNIWWGKDIA